jgi:hypothetical protein
MWKDIAFGFVMSAQEADFWRTNRFKVESMYLERSGVKSPAWTADKEESARRSETFIADRAKALSQCSCQLMACGNDVVVVSFQEGQADKQFLYIKKFDLPEAEAAATIPALRQFCQLLGITYQEPQWLIVRPTASIK